MPIHFEGTVTTPEDALNAFASGSILLDVRIPEAHDSACIEGSLNLCVYEVAFYEKVPQAIPDKRTPVLVFNQYTHSKEGTVAAQKLASMGYENVSLIQGDLQGLLKAGFALAGEAEGLREVFTLEDGVYTLEEAEVEWTGRNRNGKHTGSVRCVSGTLTVREGRLTGAFVIDMDSIANHDLADPALNKMLVTHLKSDDFFSTTRFPTATLTVTEGKAASAANCSNQNHTIHGTLSLAGTTHPLDFPATLVQTEPGELIGEAHFDFDRTLWKIAYGSARFFVFLGMHMVFDPVTVSVRVRMQRG